MYLGHLVGSTVRPFASGLAFDATASAPALTVVDDRKRSGVNAKACYLFVCNRFAAISANLANRLVHRCTRANIKFDQIVVAVHALIAASSGKGVKVYGHDASQ
jgi:hypothetical protein